MKRFMYWLHKICFGLALAGSAWWIGGHRSLGGDAVDLRSRIEGFRRRQADLLN